MAHTDAVSDRADRGAREDHADHHDRARRAGGHSRRRFLERMGAAGAALALFPSIAPDRLAAARRVPQVPAGGPDESFWERVKAAFPLRNGHVPMNAANLAPAPRPVVDRVIEVMWKIEGDVSFQNRGEVERLLDGTREGVARLLGASPDEIALVRNTSEGNNIIIGGLPLGPGDEVVLFDQNHPTNAVAWDVRAARFGFRVRRVGVGEEEDAGALLDRFTSALSPATRVLAFSDVSNTSGIRLPVREICAECRRRGIHTHVDGAQSFGALRVNLHELGCDSYASSAHKWFMGPKEVGVLYVREDRIGEVWPGGVGVGWGSGPETSARGARKFETLGQRNDALLAGMGSAVEFHEGIGAERIEARVLELAALLRAALSPIPGLSFVTPEPEELHAGVVISRIEGVDERRVYRELYEEHQVAGASTGGLRLCPHVYNTRADVERAAEAVAALVARQRRG